MKNEVDIGKGKMWGRDKEWQLIAPHVYEEESGPCCEHAILVGPDKYKIPYAVIASDNGGGYHATALCLVCILNMAKKHGVEPD